MNTIDYLKNDFPITSRNIGFLQQEIGNVERLSTVLGLNYIVSGCVENGNSISSGYIVANGELMPFAGGTWPEWKYVRVVSTVVRIPINDTFYDRTVKDARIGLGGNAIAWNTFRNGTNLIEQVQGKAPLGSHVAQGQGIINYTTGMGMPAGDVNIDFSSKIPSTAKFAVVAIEHQWGYTASNLLKITRYNTDDSANSNEIIINVKNEVGYSCLVIPVRLGSFYVQDLGQYHSAMKCKFTLIGYM